MDPGVPPLPLWVHGASWEPFLGLTRVPFSPDHPGSPAWRTGVVPFFHMSATVICLTGHEWCRITSLKERHEGFREPGCHGADSAVLEGRFPRETARHGGN